MEQNFTRNRVPARLPLPGAIQCFQKELRSPWNIWASDVHVYSPPTNVTEKRTSSCVNWTPRVWPSELTWHIFPSWPSDKREHLEKLTSSIFSLFNLNPISAGTWRWNLFKLVFACWRSTIWGAWFPIYFRTKLEYLQSIIQVLNTFLCRMNFDFPHGLKMIVSIPRKGRLKETIG